MACLLTIFLLFILYFDEAQLINFYELYFCVASIKRLPAGLDSKASAAIWETQVRSLGQEDPLEKEMATYSRTLAWKIP